LWEEYLAYVSNDEICIATADDFIENWLCLW